MTVDDIDLYAVLLLLQRYVERELDRMDDHPPDFLVLPSDEEQESRRRLHAHAGLPGFRAAG